MKRLLTQGNLRVAVEGPQEVVELMVLTINLHPHGGDEARDELVEQIGGVGWEKMKGSGGHRWQKCGAENPGQLEITVFS